MRYDPKPPAAEDAASSRRSSNRGAGDGTRTGRAAAPSERDSEGPSRRSGLAKWLWPPLAAAVLGVLGGIGFAWAIDIPRVDTVFDHTPGLITEMYSRSGDVFATFSRQRRVLVDESEVPAILKQALLASEDRNFYEHGGIDLPAIVRARLANLRAGEIVEGASTLTMQLARELYLNRERTWRRKIEEAFFAVELEKTLSKDQILTLYLNQINVGAGNYGMAAAARDYFDKELAEIDLDEAATMVGILPAPSRYNPYRRPDLVLERRNSVLRRMRDAGFITREQYEEAREEPLILATRAPKERLGAYFAEDVRKKLEATYGNDAVVEGGLQVATTLDEDIQRAAEQALDRGLVRLDHRKGWRGPIARLDEDLGEVDLPTWVGAEPVADRWYQGLVLAADGGTATVRIEDERFELTPEGMAWTRKRDPGAILSRGDVAWFKLEERGEESAQGEDGGEDGGGGGLFLRLEQAPEIEGAVLVIESASGAVRAMVGGWSFERSKFNRASQAQRQVGSAFKPIVFGAALAEGWTAADTLFDAPTRFPGQGGELTYMPRNYYRTYEGVLTLRRALEKSVNVTAVKLLDLVGIPRVVEFARGLGIDAELPPYPSLALGTAEIVPIELAGAYAAIANQGTWVEPYLVERVTTPDGRVLSEHVPTTRSAMDPRVAYVLIHMMEGVVDRGTGSAVADLPIALAGKTGTTDDFSDAWFVGYTPRYTILTWVGYDLKKSLGRGMTGAEAALPIWRDVVEAGLEAGWLREGELFTPPPGVVMQPVEYYTGLLPGPGAERVIEEAFVEGTEPQQRFELEWSDVLTLPWYQQVAFYIPKEGERMPGRDEKGEEIDLSELPDREEGRTADGRSEAAR